MKPDLVDVIQFVREYGAIGASVEVSDQTRIEADLGITGDDGADLLSAAEERFGADFGDNPAAAFELAPSEFLFADEGLGIPGLRPGSRWLGRARPAPADLTVGALHRALVRASVLGPKPPFLVVRRGLAFWVEEKPHSMLRATVQAFRQGCYEGVDLIDANGRVWPVVRAVLRDPPPLLARLRPARRVRVRVRLGPPASQGLPETRARLVEVLEGDSAFGDGWERDPRELIPSLHACRSHAALIEWARSL